MKFLLLLLSALAVSQIVAFAPSKPAFTRAPSTSLKMGLRSAISNRWAKRRATKDVRRDLKELGKDFADDATVVVGDEEMPLSDFLDAEVAMYESFPDLTIDVTDDGGDEDGEGDGITVMNAVVSGTFTGKPFVIGDGEAIEANGQTVSMDTTYKFTYEDDLITNLVIVGLDPFSAYEELVASAPGSSSTSASSSTPASGKTSLRATISKRWAKRRAKREVRRDLGELGKDFADDAIVIVAGDKEMPLSEFLDAEVAMYESFPDLTVEITSTDIDDDGAGDGVCTLGAVVSGTFTGKPYKIEDGETIEANGEALALDTTYTFTYENDLITKLVIVGFDPISIYEELILESAADSISDSSAAPADPSSAPASSSPP